MTADLIPLSIACVGRHRPDNGPLVAIVLDHPRAGFFSSFDLAERGAFRALASAVVAELDRYEEEQATR
jgi:hypothetical protein